MTISTLFQPVLILVEEDGLYDWTPESDGLEERIIPIKCSIALRSIIMHDWSIIHVASSFSKGQLAWIFMDSNSQSDRSLHAESWLI